MIPYELPLSLPPSPLSLSLSLSLPLPPSPRSSSSSSSSSFFLSFLVVFIFLPPSLCDETQKRGRSGVGHLGIQMRNWKEWMIFCKFQQLGAQSLLQSLASVFWESVLYIWTLLRFFGSLSLSLSLSLSPVVSTKHCPSFMCPKQT
jgi:hypothetical protein